MAISSNRLGDDGLGGWRLVRGSINIGQGREEFVGIGGPQIILICREWGGGVGSLLISYGLY